MAHRSIQIGTAAVQSQLGAGQNVSAVVADGFGACANARPYNVCVGPVSAYYCLSYVVHRQIERIKFLK